MFRSVIAISALVAIWWPNSLHAARDGSIIVTIEEPASGGSYSAISNLRGWAVSPAGMGRYPLDVFIDDEFAFYMPIGGIRADVADVYPDYPYADASGFAMAFNYKDLQSGRHKILVRAYDNEGNYNEDVTYFSSEKFVSSFIQKNDDVDLSTTSRISLLNDQTFVVEGATFEGKQWNFNLTWDRASQSLKIAEITEGNAIVSNPSVRADSPTPKAQRIASSCNTYVVSVTDAGVAFENGAYLNWQRDDLWWDEGDAAFLIEYEDGLWIVIHYQNQTITNIDLGKRWYIFWQEFRGTAPTSCVHREQGYEDSEPLTDPLLPDYTIARIDSLTDEDMDVTPLIKYGDIDLGTYFYNRRQCKTWQAGDLLLIPVSEHPENVWTDRFVNLTRLRYSDGEEFCFE